MDLKVCQREKDEVWESFWWILWIFLPVLGWIILVIILIGKLNKSTRLEREGNELREKIRAEKYQNK